jgi:signal transduction histidine kinase
MSQLLVFLLLIAPLATLGQDQKEHVAAGKVKEDEGYLEAALQEYKKGLPLPDALNGVASINATIGNYDSVLFLLDRSRSLDSSSGNLVKNYQVEAKYWQAQNEYDQALSLLQRALDLCEENDVRSRATILSSMGSIYFSHEPDMKVATDLYERSIALCDSSAYANILARNYTRLANSYMVTGDGAKAKHYLDRAKKIADISGNLPLRAYVLSSMALLLYDEGRYEECIAFMQEPIRIKRELGQTRQLQNDLLNISETYMMVKDYSNAQKALDEGMSVSKSLKDIVYMKYFYERASALDSARGNYKGALTNLRLAMKYRDSTFSLDHLRDVKDIQQKYEAEQKEKVITAKELEIEQRKVDLAVILGSSIITILLLLMVLITVRARNRRQQNQVRLQTIVKTQEEVQQRIARDLHDGLVQTLGAAKMSLQSLSPTSDHEAVQKQVRHASITLDEAVNETRSIAHQILPYSLLKDGLVSALEDIFARSLRSYDFDHSLFKARVNEEIAINIYRIIQELVNNVLKHAPSAHVTVELENALSELRLYFSDNGPGFDASGNLKGAGLRNINTRAEMMNGFVMVTSAPQSGTTVEVIIPL